MSEFNEFSIPFEVSEPGIEAVIADVVDMLTAADSEKYRSQRFAGDFVTEQQTSGQVEGKRGEVAKIIGFMDKVIPISDGRSTWAEVILPRYVANRQEYGQWAYSMEWLSELIAKKQTSVETS